MTFVDGIQRFETKLVERMRSSFEELRRQNKTRKMYQRTYKELAQLSERELSDLGIAPGDIDDIAREAAIRG